MSPSRKSARSRSPRKSHALRRHIPKTAPTPNPPPRTRSLVHHVRALDAAGWRIVELRPSLACDEAGLWRVAITRVDFDASIVVSATDPEAALAELVRYASADAPEQP